MSSLEHLINAGAGLAAIALAAIAVVQLLQAREDRRERQRAAYASLYTAYLHLSSLRETLAGENLVTLAVNDALRPEDMLPQDWGTLVRLLGEVGSATGALGAMAYDMVAEAATRARMLVHLVKNVPGGANSAAVWALEKQVKDGIRAAAEAFEDAMRSALSWLTTHPVTVVDPRSDVGKKVQRALLEVQGRARGRRHESRLGPVGRLVGWSLTTTPESARSAITPSTRSSFWRGSRATGPSGTSTRHSNACGETRVPRRAAAVPAALPELPDGRRGDGNRLPQAA